MFGECWETLGEKESSEHLWNFIKSTLFFSFNTETKSRPKKEKRKEKKEGNCQSQRKMLQTERHTQ